jgi:hypothetical protein
MIDNCASLLPNVVHSYLPISFHEVALFAMYLFVWLGFTFKRSALLQILKERYRKKSTLNHSSRGQHGPDCSSSIFYGEKTTLTDTITDILADFGPYSELKTNSLRK